MLNITENSGNLTNGLKQDIVESVSIIRNIFVNLQNSGEEQTMKTNQVGCELNEAKAELRGSRVANRPDSALLSRGGIGQTAVPDIQDQLSSTGGAKKLYSEAVNTSVDKRFKLLVKSKFKHWTERIESALRTNTNHTVIKFGINSLWGPRWRSRLRHCATSQKVAGSIPDGVIAIFH